MLTLAFMVSHRTNRAVVAAVAVALVLGAGSAAMGQESDESSSDGSAAESKDQGSSDDGKSAEKKKDQGPDPEDPDYWAKVRKVRTVQKRAFEKVNRFGVTAYAGAIPNNIFEKYYPLGLRLNYFVLENIGVEVAGSYALEAKTSVRGIVNEPAGLGAQGVKVADSQRVHTNVGVLWSPSYGKAAFYNEAIGYFDVFLYGGIGLAVTKTPENLNQPEDQEQVAAKVEGVLGASLAYYPTDNLAIRADYRQFLFEKVDPPGGVANPSEITLGASYFIELF